MLAVGHTVWHPSVPSSIQFFLTEMISLLLSTYLDSTHSSKSCFQGNAALSWPLLGKLNPSSMLLQQTHSKCPIMALLHCTRKNHIMCYAGPSWEHMAVFTSMIPALTGWQEIVRRSINIGWMNKWMNQPLRHLKKCLEDAVRGQQVRFAEKTTCEGFFSDSANTTGIMSLLCTSHVLVINYSNNDHDSNINPISTHTRFLCVRVCKQTCPQLSDVYAMATPFA